MVVDPVSNTLKRLHGFTYAVLTAATCAVTLMIVPGQVGTTDSCFGDSWNKYEHGWPWIYLERWKGFQFGRETALPVDAVPWCHSFCWCFYDHSEQVGPTAFRPWVLAADAMCGLALVVAAGAVAQWWRRRRSRILQLSMKDLLACVLILSSALAWWRWQQNQYGEALRVANELQEKGIRSEMEYVGPAWTARLFGTGSLNICRRPVAVTLSGNAARLTHELRHHHDILSYLKHVDIQDACLSPVAIDDLAQFSHLRKLTLVFVELDDRALDKIAALAKLRELTILSCRGMTDAAIARFRQNCRLQRLLFDMVEPQACTWLPRAPMPL